MFFKKMYILGDALEDRVRGSLSHYPILYATLGGTGIVIFWRGVWHSMDSLIEHFSMRSTQIIASNSTSLPWWDGPISLLIGTVLLLTVGLFIPSFIGDSIILSGLRREKKLTEKTAEEIGQEIEIGIEMRRQIGRIDTRLERIEARLKRGNGKAS